MLDHRQLPPTTMWLLFAIFTALLTTVLSQYGSYYSQYGYSRPSYYSSPYGYNQYSSYGYNQYPGYYQQYNSYRAPSLLGRLFGGGGYNVDRYGNSYIGTPSVGFFPHLQWSRMCYTRIANTDARQ
ncbi:hypothetical protein OSTOST_02492, partial [Ostertagia ostertagi]